MCSLWRRLAFRMSPKKIKRTKKSQIISVRCSSPNPVLRNEALGLSPSSFFCSTGSGWRAGSFETRFTSGFRNRFCTSSFHPAVPRRRRNIRRSTTCSFFSFRFDFCSAQLLLLKDRALECWILWKIKLLDGESFLCKTLERWNFGKVNLKTGQSLERSNFR